MKSWRAESFGPINDVLRLQDVPDLGPPPPRTAKVKVLAAGIGLPDAFMTEGRYPLVPKPPVSPGQEVAGIVTEIGADAPFAVGDRVMGGTHFTVSAGGFSEYCYLSPLLSSKIPDHISDVQAAGFTVPYLTAHAGLVQRVGLKVDETLLVLGASGSSGSTAVQLGKALGANVIAVAGGAEKCAFCKSLGADHVVDYRAGPISKQVSAVSQGADVIFDPVGGDAYKDAVQCINTHGRIAIVGFSSGEWCALDPLDMVSRSYSAFGVFLLQCSREEINRAYSDLTEMHRTGKIRVPVAETIAFDNVANAVHRLSEGDVLGKFVVKVDSNATV